MKPHAEVSANILLSYMHAIEEQERLLEHLHRVVACQESMNADHQGG
jgi:hypothetical protein